MCYLCNRFRMPARAPVAAQDALAEEIRSQNFCEQALSLAHQQGESALALDVVHCRLLKYYQPSCRQCVLAALKLDAARSQCLAQYSGLPMTALVRAA